MNDTLRHRRMFAKLIGAGACAALLPDARAQAPWPSKPLKIIVSYAVGGTLDQAVRLIAAHAGAALGQQAVVENRTGATGTIGAAAVVQAPADGYTFLAGGDPELVLAPFIGKVPYNPDTDLVPLSITAMAPIVVAIHGERPEKTMAELIATARREPVGYATPGARSPMELGMEMLNRRLGTRFTAVPYRGGGALALDLASGQVPVALTGPLSVDAMVKAGKVRVLCVFQRERSPLLPGVPAVAESGFRDLEVIALHVFSARASVPADIRARFADAVRAAVASPEVSDKLRGSGISPVAMAPAESLRFLRETAATYQAAVATLGWDKERP
jgi:tripartite-type tricarboxylate transporter receptor subunit TctC